MERSEDQVVTKDRFSQVIFGERTFDVNPLTLRRGMKWRAYVAEKVAPFLEKPGAGDDPKAAFNLALIGCQQQIIDIVLDYFAFSDSDREYVLDNANEEQMRGAFSLLMLKAFTPTWDLRTHLPKLPEILAASASAQSSSLH